MGVRFVVIDLLDPDAVELCRGSQPEIEAARRGSDGGVVSFQGEGGGAGRDGDETAPIMQDEMR